MKEEQEKAKSQYQKRQWIHRIIVPLLVCTMVFNLWPMTAYAEARELTIQSLNALKKEGEDKIAKGELPPLEQAEQKEASIVEELVEERTKDGKSKR